MPPLPRAFTQVPIAHRALHDVTDGIIENSPTAIRRAMVAGYGIEIDVQPSLDGVAMVFHDTTLDRVTHATGPIAARPTAELAKIRLAGSDDTISTLSEVLAMVNGAVPLLIELKDQSGSLRPGADTVLEQAVAAALEGYSGPVAVMSFNPAMVATMAKLLPDVPRGITTSAFRGVSWKDIPDDVCERLREIPDFDAVGASFISHQWQDLANPPVLQLKAQGVPILCWTVTSPEIEVDARRVADGITFEGYLPARSAT